MSDFAPEFNPAMIGLIVSEALKKAIGVIKNRLSREGRNRRRFRRDNKSITIISNNCIAGFIYRDLGMPYGSPTVGLQFTQEGFVKFCRDFSSYIILPVEEDLEPSEDEFRALGGEAIDFPVGKLGDLTLFLQHYRSVDEAAITWARRKDRIDNSRLFYIFMAYDTTSISLIREFESLPLKNSIVLTNMRRPELPSSVPLLCGNAPWYSIEQVSQKPYYRRFDYINWMRRCVER